MRCNVRPPVNVQAPFLFSRETGKRFAPAFAVVSNERVELFATAKHGTETGWHHRPGVHRAFEHPLVHGGLSRNPIVIFRIPLAWIHIANYEREIPIGDRGRSFALYDEPPAREFGGHHTKQLNGPLRSRAAGALNRP